MRELMFRADSKAKRLAKIKSKTYRRLKKKQKQKLMEKIDGEGSCDDEEKRLQREVERAMERATLKHKNTGKWAKAMKGRGELDEDQRQEVLEMLQRGEKLRRKIHAKGEGGEDDEDSDDDTGDEEGIRASAFDEVARLAEEEGPGHPKKSLFSMKFMKDAMARDNQEAQDMADEFLKDLAGSDVDVASDSDDDNLQNQSKWTSGRVSFRPGAQVGSVTRSPLNTYRLLLLLLTDTTHVLETITSRRRWGCGVYFRHFIPYPLIPVNGGPPHSAETSYYHHFHRTHHRSLSRSLRTRKSMVEYPVKHFFQDRPKEERDCRGKVKWVGREI